MSEALWVYVMVVKIKVDMWRRNVGESEMLYMGGGLVV